MHFIQYCLQFGDRWIEVDMIGKTYFVGYILSSHAIGQFGSDFDAGIVRFILAVLRVKNDLYCCFCQIYE